MQITLETLRNKESRDALIDELIRMMVDGHIVTVLDFIPVERLPDDVSEDSGKLFAVLRNKAIVHFGSAWFSNYGDDGNRWEDSVIEEEILDVTHWAEIPTIE